MKSILILTLLIISNFCIAKESNRESSLQLPKSPNIECQFESSTMGNFKSNYVSMKRSNSKTNILIKEVDYNKKTGTLVGNVGESSVTVFHARSGTHILEWTPSGPHIITIFPANIVNGQGFDGGFYDLSILTTKGYRAVYSRHLFIMGTEAPSQGYGWCKFKE